MRHSLFLVFIITLLFCACKSKSLNSLYDRKTEKKDIETLVSNKAITSQEQGTLQLYLLSHLKDTSLSGKTYAALLQSAKLEDSLAQQKQKLQEELNQAVEVKVLRKYGHTYYEEGAEHRALELECSFRNLTDRRIAGFTFELSFLNSASITFYKAGWTMTESIGAHTKIVSGLSTGEYDESKQGLVQLNIADLNKIQYKARILKLLYDDGTSKSVIQN